jgi:hypothetical protein
MPPPSKGGHEKLTESHVRGSGDVPLIERTIGALFDETVGHRADHKAIVVPHQRNLWTVAELKQRARVRRRLPVLGVRAPSPTTLLNIGAGAPGFFRFQTASGMAEPRHHPRLAAIRGTPNPNDAINIQSDTGTAGSPRGRRAAIATLSRGSGT